MCEDELPMSRVSKVIVLQPANAFVPLDTCGHFRARNKDCDITPFSQP